MFHISHTPVDRDVSCKYGSLKNIGFPGSMRKWMKFDILVLS